MRLAPIGVVAEKLRARSSEARAAALEHAKGHGKTAGPLAAHIASLLADPDPIPRLAVEALSVIGAEGWAALSVLEGLPYSAVVLKAMAVIAPNAPSVEARLIDALFGDDEASRDVAGDALVNGGPADAAVLQLRLRAFSFSKAKREGAHRALAVLARIRPAAVEKLVAELARGSNPKAALAAARTALALGPLAARAVAASRDEYPDFPVEEAQPEPGRLEPADDAPPIDAELSHGLELLGRTASAPPADLAEGLQTYFVRQRDAGAAPDDTAVQGLAAVWAHCLMQGHRWSWARWVRADERALVLASPAKGHMVFPAAWVRRQLRKKEPTAVQQFNMLASARPADGEPTAVW
ncbi:MAG: hypothetical protein JNK82_21035 [Myxococcaceae bacterium]|nr:hypothetical protein [Myxococcaceae bacterium]